MSGSRAHYSPQSPQIKDFGRGSPGGGVSVPRSWSEADTVLTKNSISFSSTGNTRPRPTFSQIVSSGPPTEEKKRITVEITPQMRLQRWAACSVVHWTRLTLYRSIFRLQPRQRRQLEAHIWAYADMLLAWSLPRKRAELLESARGQFGMTSSHPVIANMLSSSPFGKRSRYSRCHDR